MEEAQEQKRGGSGKYVAIIGIIVIVVAIAGYAYKSETTQKTPPEEATVAKSAPTAAPSKTATTQYKDGTYSAVGEYTTHVGQKHINVTITLKKDIITAAEVKNEADDPMSEHYQDLFIGGFKPMVVGKDISSVQLTKVSGSSLTPGGFNSALQEIETQAKSS